MATGRQACCTKAYVKARKSRVMAVAGGRTIGLRIWWIGLEVVAGWKEWKSESKRHM